MIKFSNDAIEGTLVAKTGKTSIKEVDTLQKNEVLHCVQSIMPEIDGNSRGR